MGDRRRSLVESMDASATVGVPKAARRQHGRATGIYSSGLDKSDISIGAQMRGLLSANSSRQSGAWNPSRNLERTAANELAPSWSPR